MCAHKYALHAARSQVPFPHRPVLATGKQHLAAVLSVCIQLKAVYNRRMRIRRPACLQRRESERSMYQSVLQKNTRLVQKLVVRAWRRNSRQQRRRGEPIRRRARTTRAYNRQWRRRRRRPYILPCARLGLNPRRSRQSKHMRMMLAMVHHRLALASTPRGTGSSAIPMVRAVGVLVVAHALVVKKFFIAVPIPTGKKWDRVVRYTRPAPDPAALCTEVFPERVVIRKSSPPTAYERGS